ncbi:DUF6178 family protein [Desulfosarcina sp. OttesenSCG-928-A07]|nr:DUF6178 family protein [Desulfosarcina sp. OttesenSCG-928-G17]MDL2328755.1 DUF6178 family protein [Desulfosarcina sp. OttesenSCG-928-A07]
MSDSIDKNHLERLHELDAYRQKVLLLPTEKIVDAILDHPQSVALVHSFSEIDLHLLIRDIGLDDALPLIQLASSRQWEYFLDAEIWNRDELDYPAATRWLGLLLEADPNRLVNWCFDDQLEFVELYLFRNIELRIREFDQAPSELGEGFVTDDDTFYIRFVTDPIHMPLDETRKSQRDAMLAELLHRISAADHVRYQGLLMEASAVIPAEMEEELFRLRNVRLAEKGLLPFHEAISVFKPLMPEDLKNRSKKRFYPPGSDISLLPVPRLAASFLETDTCFVRALKRIDDPRILGQLQTEVAGLCNQVIVATQQTIHERRQLAEVVETVSHYLSIGIERMLADTHPIDDAEAAALLCDCFLADLFSVGYAGALDLRRRAIQWQKSSWFRKAGLKLSFWDEAWMGLLGGLLIDRPKCYDPAQDKGSVYRDFHTLAEINAAETLLDQIIWIDTVLPRLFIPDAKDRDPGFFTYKSLLLTSWVWSRLNITPDKDLAVPVSLFKPFYQGLWTELQGRRMVDADRRSLFADWLEDLAEKDPDLPDQNREGRLALGKSLAGALFDEVEAELSAVRPGNLDPRHIRLFLLKSGSNGGNQDPEGSGSG